MIVIVGRSTRTVTKRNLSLPSIRDSQRNTLSHRLRIVKFSLKHLEDKGWTSRTRGRRNETLLSDRLLTISVHARCLTILPEWRWDCWDQIFHSFLFFLFQRKIFIGRAWNEPKWPRSSFFSFFSFLFFLLQLKVVLLVVRVTRAPSPIVLAS